MSQWDINYSVIWAIKQKPSMTLCSPHIIFVVGDEKIATSPTIIMVIQGSLKFCTFELETSKIEICKKEEKSEPRTYYLLCYHKNWIRFLISHPNLTLKLCKSKLKIRGLVSMGAVVASTVILCKVVTIFMGKIKKPIHLVHAPMNSNS